MNAPEWTLKSLGGTPLSSTIWLLSVVNPNQERIAPGAEFKFRVDNGVWLDPPAGTPNQQRGNLVFRPGVSPPGLRAEIRNDRAVWAEVRGDRLPPPPDPRTYRLTDAAGNELPIASVHPREGGQCQITPARALDKRRVYFLEIPSLKLSTRCSFDGWFRELYSDKELGANISGDGTTTFRVFAPRAEQMRLYLYREATDAEPYQTRDLRVDADGVWEATVNENLRGVWYNLTVHGPVEPGNYFYESHPVRISDPYARVSDDTFGKCRVWPATKPATPLKNGIPPLEDVIAYEVHVQDFTGQLPVPEPVKGTIPAMTTPGLRNAKGENIGFDYLVGLGINVVQLMPVQEYLHYPDATWRAAFARDPYLLEQGVNRENYDWGYRTSHAFAVESRYRRRDTEPGAQRDQLRDLVQAFHDRDIAVVMDVAFNHTAENMDGRDHVFNFKALDAQYYYRTKNGELLGEYGNETKSEDRPMGQRWIKDQCLHFIREFGVDGFRIDLAGLTDRQTLLALKEAIGGDKILYGEPWIASQDPAYEANPAWHWYKENAPLTFFQDDSRDAFKGPISNPRHKATDRGYAGGNAALRERVKKGLTGFPEDQTPLSGINYLDIHDNWTLADQFATRHWDGRFGVDEENVKLAAVLLYTSLGPIVTHGGTELLRSKGLAPLQETVKVLPWPSAPPSKLYFHGKRDTYNLRTANEFVWDNVGKTKRDPGSCCDYANVLAYWRGLNHFRRGEHGRVFRRARAVPAGYYQWIEPANAYQLGYLVDGKVLVLLNTEPKPNAFEGVCLTAGDWRLVGNGREINPGGVPDADDRLAGGQRHSLLLPATSAKIWVRE
ncbi:MAG: pullulanase [Ferruginibacter sp.]|nr:pullulanase [Cytophagales bacterium]